MNQVSHDLIRDGLRHLSSLEMQNRLWLSSGETEWSSLEEATCQLFDDSGLNIAFDRGKPVFSPETDKQLRRLGAQLRSMDMTRAPRDIIVDPAMAEIRRIAQQILKDLDDEVE